MTRCVFFINLALAGVVLGLVPAIAAAQGSKSSAIAKELIQVMEQKQLDSIAAKVPSSEGSYAAALYFPNVQLLVISGEYSAPQLIEPRLEGKEYRETYMELSGTVNPETKIFVQDMGQPGLSLRKQDNLFDTWTQAGKVVSFDGEPGAQQISDAEYQKMFTAADEEYARILSALLLQAKK